MIIINAGRLHSLAQRLLSTCNGRDRGTCLRVGVDARPFRVDRDVGFKRRIELNGAESCPRNIILCVSWDGLDVPLVSASEDGMRASERERERERGREGERERGREGERERGRGRESFDTYLPDGGGDQSIGLVLLRYQEFSFKVFPLDIQRHRGIAVDVLIGVALIDGAPEFHDGRIVGAHRIPREGGGGDALLVIDLPGRRVPVGQNLCDPLAKERTRRA